MFTLNFSSQVLKATLKFSFLQNLSSHFSKMAFPCSSKDGKLTIHHWKLYSKIFWLVAGQMNELQHSIVLNLSWTSAGMGKSCTIFSMGNFHLYTYFIFTYIYYIYTYIHIYMRYLLSDTKLIANCLILYCIYTLHLGR